ncbi:hypothetical protein HF325_004195 [Metschnikowia pulcherrima]|uniref:Uncharacterized protein n=1 Tax=Metschnikowia pulcherrima TaxID=27326 RepID=A0A8H7LAY0_9ASCO|nr:hypothetical protein HF325_004195 [Metschnikowia pulcherrima]
MLDPESFMKNSPFRVTHTNSYNLSNTTPELLKFQLQEQSRAQLEQTQVPDSLFAGSAFNNHLQDILNDNPPTLDDDHDTTDNSLHGSHNSAPSTPNSDISDSWKAVADQKDLNYSNMRVLIENSVFDTSRISPQSLLSLAKLKRVKQSIAEKTEMKQYLQLKCLLSSQFCATLLPTPEAPPSDVDPLLLLKILKQLSDLQLQMIKVTQELDQLELQLKNHNLFCLVSGYIEDVRLSSSSRSDALDGRASRVSGCTDAESQRFFEELFSHIVSLAAQKNVSLPDYSSSSTDTLRERISWASDCISALAAVSSLPSSATNEESFQTGADDESLVKDHSFLSLSPYKIYKKDESLEKILSEYKLALNDLKFSQEYFSKEYEYLKENSLKTILDYRRKNAYLEKELSRLREQPSDHPQSQESLKTKDREIYRLRRELNCLKIEVLGDKSPRASTAVNSSLLSSLESETQDERASNPMVSPSRLKATSTAILRKEFKKIVEDIQDQYEIELEEERAKRRLLEMQMLSASVEK